MRNVKSGILMETFITTQRRTGVKKDKVKVRRKWLINPSTKVLESGKGFKRARFKKQWKREFLLEV